MTEFEGNNLLIDDPIETEQSDLIYANLHFKDFSFDTNQLESPDCEHLLANRIGVRTLSYNADVEDCALFTFLNIQFIPISIGIDQGDDEYAYMEFRPTTFFVNDPIGLYSEDVTLIKMIGQIVIPPNIVIQ